MSNYQNAYLKNQTADYARQEYAEASYASTMGSTMGSINAARDPSPVEEAERSLNLAFSLISAIEELEVRLFGPIPLSNGATPAEKSAPSLASSLRVGRQCLETASNRLGMIIQRL